MAKHWWLPLAILCAGAVVVWPLREHLTAAEIAARSPGRPGWRRFSCWLCIRSRVCPWPFPLGAGGGGRAALPVSLALAVNLAGVMAAQTAPYLLGRGGRRAASRNTGRGFLAAALDERYSSCGWREWPQAIWSASTCAAGVPWGAYLTGGVLGAFPGACRHAAGRRAVGSSAPPASSSLCSPAPR